MFKTIGAIAALSTLLLAGTAQAEPVKVGMITTLSGGGAGLGIDVRDGFMLAVKQSGNKDLSVVIKDDQRKPGIAHRNHQLRPGYRGYFRVYIGCTNLKVTAFRMQIPDFEQKFLVGWQVRRAGI